MQQQGTVFIGNYSFNQNDILGKGVTGNVFKGKRTSDDYPVAIKVINLKQNQNDITLSLLETQLKALKMIKHHPNLIRSLDILQDQNFCFIVTEFYSGGTLKQLLEKQGSFNSQLSLQIFHKIISAYCAISDASIIHRDLKPANIMLKQCSLEPVIIDFGFAEIIQTKTVMKAFNVGSPAYMAPEAYTKTLYSEKSDVWSLGIILYEMLMGQTLDEGIQTKRYFDILSDNFIAQKIVSFGQIFKQILSQVLRMNVFERISIHKIKYILDKHMIMKLNNPIKSLHSSIQFIPPVKGLKSQPLLMNKSNSFDEENNKQIKSVFQSGHFDMFNSVRSTNGSSNLSIFNENKIQAKQTESRYRVNMMSPVRHVRTKQITQVNRSIEKSNQLQFRNCVAQKINTLEIPRRLQTQPIQNFSQMSYQKQHFYSNNQPFKSKENSRVQTQYLALKPRQTNLMSVVPQKQYFNQPQNIIRPNKQFTSHQPKNQYPQQPLVFRQTFAEEKKVIKQKSSNPNKFSFKKMAQYQENSSNQYFLRQNHQGGKQNVILRHHQMGQGVTQLNFNQNFYNSVHQNSNLITRTHFNQPLNHNIQQQPSIVRRIF